MSQTLIEQMVAAYENGNDAVYNEVTDRIEQIVVKKGFDINWSAGLYPLLTGHNLTVTLTNNEWLWIRNSSKKELSELFDKREDDCKQKMRQAINDERRSKACDILRNLIEKHHPKVDELGTDDEKCPFSYRECSSNFGKKIGVSIFFSGNFVSIPVRIGHLTRAKNKNVNSVSLSTIHGIQFHDDVGCYSPINSITTEDVEAIAAIYQAYERFDIQVFANLLDLQERRVLAHKIQTIMVPLYHETGLCRRNADGEKNGHCWGFFPEYEDEDGNRVPVMTFEDENEYDGVLEIFGFLDDSFVVDIYMAAVTMDMVDLKTEQLKQILEHVTQTYKGMVPCRTK